MYLWRELRLYGFMGRSSRFPCCVLLVLSWNTNENPSTDKLSRAINKVITGQVGSDGRGDPCDPGGPDDPGGKDDKPR